VCGFFRVKNISSLSRAGALYVGAEVLFWRAVSMKKRTTRRPAGARACRVVIFPLREMHGALSLFESRAGKAWRVGPVVVASGQRNLSFFPQKKMKYGPRPVGMAGLILAGGARQNWPSGGHSHRRRKACARKCLILKAFGATVSVESPHKKTVV